MLNVDIHAEDYELTDELRQRATAKFGELGKYMQGLENARVEFSWTGGKDEQTTVKAQVSGGGHSFDASATDWKATTALDESSHKLQTEIAREKGKELDQRNHRS
jgi:ribosomal subunit interface protein